MNKLKWPGAPFLGSLHPARAGGGAQNKTLISNTEYDRS